MTPAFIRLALNKGIQMKEVERHSVTGYGRQDINYNDPEGEFVYYEDYAKLQQQLTATTNSLTNAQEALKSAGIEADTVQAGVMELVDKLRIKQNHIKLRDTYIEELEQREEAAEAKLAELEKQAPVEYRVLDSEGDVTARRSTMTEAQETVNRWNKGWVIQPVFTRPVPAIDLNAVRADAVVEAFVTVFDVCSRDDHIDEKLWNYGVLRVEKHADEYVAQLRAGNAGKDGV